MDQQFAADGWDDTQLQFDHGVVVDDGFTQGHQVAVLVISLVERTNDEVVRVLDALGIGRIKRAHTLNPGGQVHATVTGDQVTLHAFMGETLVILGPADDDWISAARERGELTVIVCWDPCAPELATIRRTSQLWSSGALPIR